MGIISSINFKKSNAIQTRHNDRDLPPNYLIGGNCEANRNHEEALKLKNQIVKNAIETYNSNKAPKAPPFKAKSYEWSAVCNIKPNTTMQDLERLAEHFNDKYGFQCYQIAIHRDEGHINEQGQKVINHHAHLEFITLDKNTGKNNYRRELITPKALRQMQTEVAEILQMERGQDKRITKRQRIEPRKYAQMKEQERKALQEQYQTLYKDASEVILSQKQQILTLMEQKARLEQERKLWIQEKTHTAEEYKALRALAEKGKTAEQLESEIQSLREKHIRKDDELRQQRMRFIDISEAYKKEKESLKSKINTLESDLKHEKQKNDVLVAKTKEIDFRAISDNLKLENEKLRQENQELRKNIAEFQTQIGQKSILNGKEIQTTTNEQKSLKIENSIEKQEIYTIQEIKQIFSYKEKLDELSRDIRQQLSRNYEYLTHDGKENCKKEITQKVEKTNIILQKNPHLETFFSLEKYKDLCNKALEWLRDKVMKQKERDRGFSR